MNLVIGLLIGVAFGFIIHRAGASQYRNILNTLLLKDMKILKFMVMAIAVGMVGIYALDIFGLANLGIKSTYVMGVIIGGLIFGSGFAISGYCPGTAVCALGEGKKDAMFTIFGGLTGAFAYSFAYPLLKPVIIEPLNYGKITLANMLPVPAIVTAVIVAAALAAVAYILPTAKVNNQ